MIHDLFFFHERARKINIWAFTFLIGPYLGPFLSGFIVEGLDWRNTFGVLAGFYGLSVIMIILFGDETLYNREGFQKPRTPGLKGRIFRLTGIEGVQSTAGRPSVWEVTKDLFSLLTRPYLLIPSMFPLDLS
jgi:MFS family permease